MALDRLIDSQAEDGRRDWMAQIIQMKRNLQTPLQYDSYYGFAGDILQIVTETSGIKVVSGTQTLASASSTIDVTTGESGLPFLAVIEKSEPTLNQDGCDLCIYIKLPVALNMNQASWLKENGYTALLGEARTTYNNYANFFNATVSNTNPFTTGVQFRCRNSSYKFFAGAYRWVALYGEVYA